MTTKNELLKHVVLVGADKCWKSTMVKELASRLGARTYSDRTSEQEHADRLMKTSPRVIDRGIVCSRVYNRIHRRHLNTTEEYDKGAKAAEAAMKESGAVYVFLDRDDFTGVEDKDDRMDGVRLKWASNLYKSELAQSGVPFERFTVEDDTGTDESKWIELVGDIMAFLRRNGAIEE